jgi:hypothetical protein
VTASGLTNGLESAYVIERRAAVFAFIARYRLHGLLLEAIAALNAAFGKESVKTLTLILDDEGEQSLFGLVMITGDAEGARRSLRAFDQEWWLAHCRQAAGKLNFDLELV